MRPAALSLASNMLLATLLIAPATADAEVDAASKRALFRSVRQSPVIVMGREVVGTTPRPTRTPPTTSTPTPVPRPHAAPPMAAAPPSHGPSVAPRSGPSFASATAPAMSQPPAPAPPASPDVTVVPAPPLVGGELFLVPLHAEQERTVLALLREQVTPDLPPGAASLQTVGGVLRQLATDGAEVQLKPFAMVGQALKYLAAERKFRGTVAVGVVDLIGGAGSRPLSVPMVFEVVETAQRVSLDQTSPPFERFDVSTEATGEPLTLHVASNFSQERIAVTVPVEPTLLVEADNDLLRGLGLQTTRITVRAVGGAGRPASIASLSAPGAFLDDSSPRFDANGVAHAQLRSDRAGNVTVTATATGYVSGRLQPIRVRWPWQTLIATILGGLVGGFVRLGPKIRRGMNVSRFAVGLAVAVLTGLLVFVLYVLGVKVLPVTFGVEVGDLFAFAAAALGGWLGSAVLPRLKPGRP